MKFLVFLKKNIYFFGVLSNIIPIIALIILGWTNFTYLNKYQLFAWISGSIYYIFMWVFTIFLINKVQKNTEHEKKLEDKVKLLEDKIEKIMSKKVDNGK